MKKKRGIFFFSSYKLDNLNFDRDVEKFHFVDFDIKQIVVILNRIVCVFFHYKYISKESRQCFFFNITQK